MIYYFIPARKGSKDFPGKNRILFKNTAELVKNFKNVFVSSNDEEIEKLSKEYNFNFFYRPEFLCADEISIRDVLEHFVNFCNLKQDDIIVLLYLTYPYRKIDDLNKALEIFDNGQYKSLLCRQKVLTHPFLCIYKDGKKIIDHDFYRRQDYPEIFEISHYICMIQCSELSKVGKNLQNINTFYMNIDRVLDIDYEKDFIKKEIYKND